MGNAITYKSQIRKESDEFSSLLGMIILLASLSILFIALLASYSVLRVRSVNWASKSMSDYSIILSWINTLMIVSSSFIYFKVKKTFMEYGDTSIKWLNLSIFSGLLFLGMQLALWLSLFQEGFTIHSHQAGSVFYMLSGLHGLHITIGLLALLWLKKKIVNREGPILKIKLVGMFWHFLTIIWLVIFFSVIIF